MNPRKPIGMSESAKKRAAETEAVARWKREADVGIPWDRCYMEARALYRVGERLRPCPGCPGCLRCALCGQPASCYGKYDGMLRPEHHCDACCGHGNEDGWCDPIGAECERCDAVGMVSTGEMSIGGDYIEVRCPTCNDARRVAICDGSGVLPAKTTSLKGTTP